MVKAIGELNRVIRKGLIFGSITSDLPAALIDRYNLLRGVKKLGTWWEWSELFFANGFDLSMHRRDVTAGAVGRDARGEQGPGPLVRGRRIRCATRSSTRRPTTIEHWRDRSGNSPKVRAVIAVTHAAAAAIEPPLRSVSSCDQSSSVVLLHGVAAKISIRSERRAR